MAKLKNNGYEIGRIERLDCILSFRSNGKILENYEDGWKLYATVAENYNINDAFNNAKRIHDTWNNTKQARYKNRIIEIAGMERMLLHAIIESMPDDPDGIWAECCYGNKINATVGEIVELCRLYKRAMQ